MPKTNLLGHDRAVYKGSPTTLCQGCGHNSVTNHIIKALYEASVDPFMMAKMSGIGCSSKTPAYFLGRSHGFNAVHGRMPAISLGAKLANAGLQVLGVSGDGDTASIGIGQFCHMVRRNVDMLYIIENNGVYGLTKGQFSATADVGAELKSGEVNELAMIDCCGLAIHLGGTFVARTFSGDGKQVVPLIQAGLAHPGTAVIDIISPCITFNNHRGATKSYDWVNEHKQLLHQVDYVLPQEEITADYEPGEMVQIDLPDGSHLQLKKLERDYDPRNRTAALAVLGQAEQEEVLLTGLLYVDTNSTSFGSRLGLTDTPLAKLTEKELRPSAEALAEILDTFA